MKKLLSLLLAVIMAVSVLPATAIAAEADSLDLLPLGEPAAQEAEEPAAEPVIQAGEAEGDVLKKMFISVAKVVVDSTSNIGGFEQHTYEYNIDALLGPAHSCYVHVDPVSATATIKLQVNGGDSVDIIANEGYRYVGINYGANVIKITISDNDKDDIVYTFNVNCYARAEMKKPLDTDTGTSYYLFSTNEEIKKKRVLNTGIKTFPEYWLFIPDTVTSITMVPDDSGGYWEPNLEGLTVTYNGSESTVVDVSNTDKIEVRTVLAGVSDYTWTIHIVKRETAKVEFNIPEGATVRVFDNMKKELSPKADNPHIFAGLQEGIVYNYVVIKNGYVSYEGSFDPANVSGPIEVTLQPLPASSHKEYNGEWTNFRGNNVNMAIRSAKTPTAAKYTKLKWAVKMGTDMWMSPTPPIILNDMEIDGVMHDVLICAMGRNIYLLDKETGKVLKSAPMKGSAYFATNPITYAEGMVFVQLDNNIQAFDATTLESVWLSERFSGGQTISPITYHNGYIYIGMWNGETADGTFACFSVADEKPDQTDETKYATWTLKHKGGFYWAGAYATDNYVVFGSDDGTSEGDYTANAILYSVKPETGEIIDKIEGIKGDIRSTVAYYEGACYAVTKGGLFLKAPISADGHFDHDAFQTVEMGNMCTSTPIIYNGKAFIGTSGASQFGSPGTLNVIDVNTMKIVENVTLPGYPQAPMLMTTGYEEETGDVYIYTTYNAPPGGLYCVTWNTKDDTFSLEHIFVPESSMQQYCLGSPICDSEGTIYYKNDSGYLFALEVDNEAVAKDVEELIAAIGTVTKDSGEAIKAARDAYNALTEGQKALVSKDSVAALEKAEKIYDMIIASNKPAASDKGDKANGSVIKISATGAAKGEQNPNTGAEVFGE